MGYKKFSGELAFLSNFYPCNVSINGLHFTSSEAAYQSFKNLDYQAEFTTMGAGKSKRHGSEIPLRSDWNQVKLPVMKEVVTAKFKQNSILAHKLMLTSDCDLVEENSHGDRFWGTCNGSGENHLGKILLEVKRELEEAVSKFLSSNLNCVFHSFPNEEDCNDPIYKHCHDKNEH